MLYFEKLSNSENEDKQKVAILQALELLSMISMS